MIISINQPAYLPWLGYFDRIARSDIHVVLDHVQFEKNSFINRNRIRVKDGTCWLSIPVATKGKFGNLSIRSLQFAPGVRWQDKHWAALRLNYARATCFDIYRAGYESIYSAEWPDFITFFRAMLVQHMKDLGLNTRIVYSSDLAPTGAKSDLILNICRHFGANIYISGVHGKGYLDTERFRESGISVEFQDYQHPSYGQVWPGFESHLGILDLLFNCGADSREIIVSVG